MLFLLSVKNLLYCCLLYIQLLGSKCNVFHYWRARIDLIKAAPSCKTEQHNRLLPMRNMVAAFAVLKCCFAWMSFFFDLQ
uniref:Secreted protein n=1 Tax=Pyxicephalus adspersus TaxID=30357 RepID=A0AAV2ZXF4_PYXAD|nr:TPA: hypothetical protein GDO54_015819 [Pyxicephalus adspersus]